MIMMVLVMMMGFLVDINYYLLVTCHLQNLFSQQSMSNTIILSADTTTDVELPGILQQARHQFAILYLLLHGGMIQLCAGRTS